MIIRNSRGNIILMHYDSNQSDAFILCIQQYSESDKTPNPFFVFL